jgi:WD40 repeat protein
MLTLSPDDRFLVVVGLEGRAFVLPLDGGPARKLEGFSSEAVLGPVAVSPSGRLVATFPWFGGEKTLRVWDLLTGETRAFEPPQPPSAPDDDESATGLEGRLGSLVFKDESTLYTGGAGGVRQWDLETGSHEDVVPAEWDVHLNLEVSPDRSTVIVQGFGPGQDAAWHRDHHAILRPRLVDLETGETRELPDFDGFFKVKALDVSGAVAVTEGVPDGVLRVGRLSGPASHHVLVGHEGSVQTVAISPDSRWIATSGEDDTLRLWPMPDLDQPPLHTLPHGELVAKLKSLTNLRAVRSSESATGWTIELGPFPGWKDVPTW